MSGDCSILSEDIAIECVYLFQALDVFVSHPVGCLHIINDNFALQEISEELFEAFDIFIVINCINCHNPVAFANSLSELVIAAFMNIIQNDYSFHQTKLR